MFGVKANVRAPHRFLRFGALCWLVLTNPGGGNDRFQVRGMSRGGRMVETWVDARDLTNYRAGWVHDDAQDVFPFETREAAQEWADAMGACYAADPVRPHAAAFGKPPADLMPGNGKEG